MRSDVIVLAFSMLALTAGCATPPPERVHVDVPLETSFVFVDVRPMAQKASGQPIGVGSDLTLGDDSLNPSTADALRATLELRLHRVLAGKTVTLRSSEVSVSDAAATSTARVDFDRLSSAVPANSVGLVAAPIAALIISAIEGRRSSKYFYVYVRVEGDVEGKPFIVKLSEKYSGKVTIDHIQSTVLTVARLAAIEIEETLGHP